MTDAVVAGATGLVGGHLVRQLVASGRYGRVVALVRRAVPEMPGVTQQVVDFGALRGALNGFGGASVFCCLGTTIKKAGSQDAFRAVDFTAVTELAAEAERTGAAQWLSVSALGADAKSSVFYNRVKGEADASVMKHRVGHISIFRPSLLLGDRTESRPGEKVGMLLAPVFTPLLRGPLRAYRPITAEAVARAMVRQAGDAVPGIHVLNSDRIQALADRPS